MSRQISILALLLVAGAVAGCSGHSDRCTSDQDCFSDEFCSASGFCRAEADAGTQADTGHGGDSGSVSDTGGGGSGDTGGGGNDVGNGGGDAGSDTGTGDASNDTGGDAGPTAACVVDPFDHTCNDDDYEPNNEWIDGEYVFQGMSVGCNPDFQPVQTTIDATQCARDQEDWYYFNYVPCDSTTFVIELQLDVQTECDPSMYDFAPYSMKCEDDNVECTVENGKPTIRALINPGNQVQSFYWSVDNTMRNDVMFDYSMTVDVHE